MNYMDFCKMFDGKQKKRRVSSVKMLTESDTKVVFETVSMLGDIVTVYENGEIVYCDPDTGRSTVFAVVSYWMRGCELDQSGRPVYSYKEASSMDETDESRGVAVWVSNIIEYGRRRLTHNTKSRENLVYIDNLDYEQQEKLMSVESFEDDLCNGLFVKELMDCLSDKHSKIVYLRFWERLTFREIAEVLNEKEKDNGKNFKNTKESVRKELTRALSKMKRKAHFKK